MLKAQSRSIPNASFQTWDSWVLLSNVKVKKSSESIINKTINVSIYTNCKISKTAENTDNAKHIVRYGKKAKVPKNGNPSCRV
jgi:hypothetical protein